MDKASKKGIVSNAYAVKDATVTEPMLAVAQTNVV